MNKVFCRHSLNLKTTRNCRNVIFSLLFVAVGCVGLSSCIFSHPVISKEDTRWSTADPKVFLDFQGLQDSYGANEITEDDASYYFYSRFGVHDAGLSVRVYSKATREYIGEASYNISDKRIYKDKAYGASITLTGGNETGLSCLDLDGKTIYRYTFPDSERDARFAWCLRWSADGAVFQTYSSVLSKEGEINYTDDIALPLDHYLGKLDYLGTKIVFRMAFLDGGRYEAIRYDGKDGEALFSGSYSTTKEAMEATVESSSLPSFPYASFHFVPDVGWL